MVVMVMMLKSLMVKMITMDVHIEMLVLTRQILITAYDTSAKKTKFLLGEVLHAPANCEKDKRECILISFRIENIS